MTRHATFPSRRPLLVLDRVFVRPGRTLRAARALVSPLTRRASGHLPLRVELDLWAALPGARTASSA